MKTINIGAAATAWRWEGNCSPRSDRPTATDHPSSFPANGEKREVDDGRRTRTARRVRNGPSKLRSRVLVGPIAALLTARARRQRPTDRRNEAVREKVRNVPTSLARRNSGLSSHSSPNSSCGDEEIDLRMCPMLRIGIVRGRKRE